MNRWIVFLAAALALQAGAVDAQTVLPIEVTQTSLATTKDATTIPYYVFDLPSVVVPEEMRLEEAYVEFYMDVTSTLSDDVTGGAVTLEIYPFGGTTNGKLDVSKLGASSMKRTVAVGTNQRVRVYVTDFVQRSIADPNASRSLIVGSMAGQRIGRFDAKPVPGAASGSKAVLTVYFQRIEEAKASVAN